MYQCKAYIMFEKKIIWPFYNSGVFFTVIPLSELAMF